MPDAARCPTAFRALPGQRRWERAHRTLTRLTGRGLFPPDAAVEAFCADMYRGDPLAERFVADTFFGDLGQRTSRELLDRALAGRIADVPDAPESMMLLFAEFETVPVWVDRELVERGAAVWRRWGTMLFAVAGATTIEMYSEAALAVPLSLAGGYAGDNALRRFLETVRFWIDVSTPGALFELGSEGRATAMRVRVMHVKVRRRVADHDEWDGDRWGLPISQAWAEMTLMGGSVGPAAALWATGIHTTPAEVRALLHFNRYIGHLLGVSPSWYPETVADGLRLLALTLSARSYDAGDRGRELIESFPTAFAPRPSNGRFRRLRQRYTHTMYSAYSALWMSPSHWRRYDMPSPWPGFAVILLRWPAVAVVELARRFTPGLAERYEAIQCRHREAWYDAQMEGRVAQFEAASQLRR